MKQYLDLDSRKILPINKVSGKTLPGQGGLQAINKRNICADNGKFLKMYYLLKNILRIKKNN